MANKVAIASYGSSNMRTVANSNLITDTCRFSYTHTHTHTHTHTRTHTHTHTHVHTHVHVPIDSQLHSYVSELQLQLTS